MKTDDLKDVIEKTLTELSALTVLRLIQLMHTEEICTNSSNSALIKIFLR
jgi:hypothetical protein